MNIYFKAEKMKYRHTFLWKLMILMPAVSTLLSAQLTHNYFAMDGYNWWYMLMMPGFLAVACGQIGGKDYKKQNRTIWALPADMGKIWDAKVLLAVLISGLAALFLLLFVLIGAAVLERGLHITFFNAPAVPNQILAAILIWLTSLWQLPFCLVLVQKTGMLVMVLISVGLSQAAGPLMALEKLFFLVPYGITPRVMCPVLKTLPNGLPAQPGQMTYTSQLMSAPAAVIGVAVSLLWFGVLWYFTRKWFQRQVER